MKDKLLRAIEEKTGLSMQHNNDFITLSNLLFNTLHKRISPSTLKRVWGYVNSWGVKPRPYTLDTLANYLGASDFSGFSTVGGVILQKGRKSRAPSLLFLIGTLIALPKGLSLRHGGSRIAAAYCAILTSVCLR